MQINLEKLCVGDKWWREGKRNTQSRNQLFFFSDRRFFCRYTIALPLKKRNSWKQAEITREPYLFLTLCEKIFQYVVPSNRQNRIWLKIWLKIIFSCDCLFLRSRRFLSKCVWWLAVTRNDCNISKRGMEPSKNTTWRQTRYRAIGGFPMMGHINFFY